MVELKLLVESREIKQEVTSASLAMENMEAGVPTEMISKATANDNIQL